MSKCDLRLELERTGETYRAGEEVRGAVHVSVDQAVKCNRLTVALEWQTHGQGNRASGEEASELLFEGEWQAGDELRFPFSIRVPNGPFTYHGHLLNVDWHVKARADIPWALDPKAEHAIAVVPGNLDAPINRGPLFDHKVSATANRAATGCVILFFLPFFLGGVASLTVGTLHYMGRMEVEGTAWVAFPLGIVFTLVGLLPFFGWLHTHLANRRVGDVETLLSRDEAKGGDRVQATLAFEPRSEFLVNRVVLELRGRETVVRGSGSNRKTMTHDLASKKIVLAEGDLCLPFERRQFDAEFDLPSGAPPTFLASDNKLEWTVEMEIDIPNWPDWSKSMPIVVNPSRSS